MSRVERALSPPRPRPRPAFPFGPPCPSSSSLYTPCVVSTHSQGFIEIYSRSRLHVHAAPDARACVLWARASAPTSATRLRVRVYKYGRARAHVAATSRSVCACLGRLMLYRCPKSRLPPSLILFLSADSRPLTSSQAVASVRSRIRRLVLSIDTPGI